MYFFPPFFFLRKLTRYLDHVDEVKVIQRISAFFQHEAHDPICFGFFLRRCVLLSFVFVCLFVSLLLPNLEDARSDGGQQGEKSERGSGGGADVS